MSKRIFSLALVMAAAACGKLETNGAGPASSSSSGRGEDAGMAPRNLFGATLVNASGDSVPASRLEGKPVGIYFSAHWCPPCQVFTPKLVEAYNEIRKRGRPFEIVFISSDYSEGAMAGYMREAHMPWLAVPFGDAGTRANVSERFGVRGIPTLVILGSDGTVLSRDARTEVATSGADAYDAWVRG